MARLTAKRVNSITKPGHYSDGEGLLLKVNKGGSKYWILRIQVDKRRRDYGLGPVSMLTLAEAREAAREARRAIHVEGRNPFAERQRPSVPTFTECVDRTYELLSARWRSEKTAKQWRSRLDEYAIPRIGELQINHVRRDDVLGILEPIWVNKPEVARKLRQSLKAVFGWAVSSGYVQTNLAGEVLDGALVAQPKVKSNFRALPHGEVSEALNIVFRFVVLTAARSGEARNAEWSEIDLTSRTWTIPAQKMKANVEHRVPLSDAAVDVLKEAHILSGGEGLIFPSPMKPHKPLSDMALTKLLRDVGLARATVHGFRSSFRDWCADTGKPRELAEAALAHVVGGVEGAYFRSDLFERRMRLMRSWSDYLAGSKPAKIFRLSS